jgi:hypothetical protein
MSDDVPLTLTPWGVPLRPLPCSLSSTCYCQLLGTIDSFPTLDKTSGTFLLFSSVNGRGWAYKSLLALPFYSMNNEFYLLNKSDTILLFNSV